MKRMQILIVAIILSVGYLMYMFNFKYRSLNLNKDSTVNEAPSIYTLIKSQIDSIETGKDLDYSNFPSIGGVNDEIQYAPGAMDALFGGMENNDKGWKKVKLVIDAINVIKISDWKIVEINIKGVNVAANIDKLLEKLTFNDISPKVKELFLETAIKSNNYEAVKWGIGISGIEANTETIKKHLVLARHPEFTLYVSHVLYRESEKQPKYKRYLIELLPNSYQWGVIRLIDYIILEKELINRKKVQRDILVYGMENNQCIPMEVGFTIAKAIDIYFFLNEAQKDIKVRDAIISLMNTLMLEPSPLGGINELENGKDVFNAYFSFLKVDIPDVQTLGSLYDIKVFLEDDELNWSNKDQLLKEVEKEYKSKFNSEIISRGLKNDQNRWLALNIISRDKLVEFRSDIRHLFNENPTDFGILNAFGAIASKEDIQIMFDKIPEIVNLESRKKQPFSKINVMGPEHKNGYIYSKLISFLGKNPTEPIVNHIKKALSDYDPSVRSAACNAVSTLPNAVIDDEIKKLIRERLNDSPDYVKESAKQTADQIGI